MGWNDPTETFVAGSGEVYSAAVGTALPITPTAALDANFNGLGYHTEDGVSIKNAPDIVRKGAFQSKTPVRIIRNADVFSLSFVLLQYNEQSIPLALGGGTITNAGGVYKYVPPSASAALDERAFICDVNDGARHLRFIIPRGIAVETVESKFSRTDLAELPITVEALAPSDGSDPWFFYTDDAAAFVGGS